jgi:hypothetical protein
MPPPLGVLLCLPIGHHLTHHGFMIEPQRWHMIVNAKLDTIRSRPHDQAFSASCCSHAAFASATVLKVPSHMNFPHTACASHVVPLRGEGYS